MSLTAFSTRGRFFKGNLHSHSNRFDGFLEPEDVCRCYRERGCDFPLTDTTAYQTEKFNTITGAELRAPEIQVEKFGIFSQSACRVILPCRLKLKPVPNWLSALFRPVLS